MSRLPRKMLRSPLKHPTGVFLNAAFNSPPSQIVKTWKSHRKGGFSMFWWTASVNSRTHYFSRLRADYLGADLRSGSGCVGVFQNISLTCISVAYSLPAPSVYSPSWTTSPLSLVSTEWHLVWLNVSCMNILSIFMICSCRLHAYVAVKQQNNNIISARPSRPHQSGKLSAL